MKLKKNKEKDSRPINLVLLAVSFIIFSVLGIVFITQMELHAGWAWEELRESYPVDVYAFETEDLNGNGVNEIIGYADIDGTDRPEYYDTLNFGGIFCLEGSNGNVLWAREYDGPVKKVFPIMDVDGDGVKDYFTSRTSVGANWTVINSHYEPHILRNFYTNQLINGSDGTDIPILTGDGLNFTNFYVHDLISFNDLTDSQEDLILLEGEGYKVVDGNHTWTEYNCSINTYFINGTKKNSIYEVFDGSIRSEEFLPAFELFQYIDQSHLLFLNRDSMFLYNLSSDNMLDEIYNTTFSKSINDYEIIEDLNLDGIPEILIETWDGNITLLDGFDGGELYNISIGIETWDTQITEIHSAEGDGICYFLIKMGYKVEDEEYKLIHIYSLTNTSHELIWNKEGPRRNFDVFVLEEDFDGDSVDEIIYYVSHRPIVGFGEVNRYKIISIVNGKEFALINTGYSGDSVITISDFDGDGKKDFALAGDDSIIALSTRKPLGLWLSPMFPLGFPLFVVLAILLVAGVIIIILRGKRLQYRRQAVGQYKLTVAVNVLAIGLMTLTFILFLILMNVFNNTLITGSNNSNIVIAFLLVTIIWYGTLPLTAALYNRFAPQFAYVFIKLRNLFFKVSKGYKHDILVLDMGDRKDIGLIIQLKRLVLPLLLSIAVGFYTYDALTTLFKYPTTFTVFGSTEFFNFMMGYMLFCILPMIFSFLLFAFFISGNYLLDDAGIVYYRENKKYRQPGDIEPISIWAQSIVKGIAGLSALITFGAFLSSVDFSGFFGEGDAFNLIFGFLITIVMFFGIPFLTAFSYILLAGEVMELSAEENIKKLYNIMENNGYDTKPHDITKIYPSGYEASKRETSEKRNEDNSILSE